MSNNSSTEFPSSGKMSAPGVPWARDYAVHLICKDCREDPANIIEDYSAGDTICGSCGLVLLDHLVDTRPEWRTFAGCDKSGPDPNRCGDTEDFLLEGNQLNTAITFTAGVSNNLVYAQRRVQKNPANKTLLAAYSDITSFCENMQLMDIVAEAAKEYYKKSYESKVVKGRDNVAVIGSCIFLACRCCGVPRTFSEIMLIVECSKKDIGRIFRTLSKLFQDEGREKSAALMESGAVETQHFSVSDRRRTTLNIILRLCEKLGLSYGCQKIAEELVEEVQRESTLGGRGPRTTAAAIVFFVSHLKGNPRTTTQIAKALGVGSGPIKCAYKELYKQRLQLADPGWALDGINLLPGPSKRW